MSATTILDDALLARIARDLHEMAVAYPTSGAAQIKSEFFDQVVDAVARDIDITFADFEIAMIAALSRVKERTPEWFNRRRPRANDFSVRWKHK